MGIANKTGADETSGLYDLKELATSAKKRRSQRLSSEVDAQQSLLQSSAALDAVALPDPKKSQEIAIPSYGLDTHSDAATSKVKNVAASATEAAVVTEQPSAAASSKTWLLAGTALIAIAGVAAFVLLKGGAESTATTGGAPVLTAAANAPESEIPTPVQALPIVAAEDEEADDALEPAPEAFEAVTVAAVDDGADEAEDESKSKSAEPSKSPEDTSKRSASSETRSEAKQSAAAESGDKLTKAEARAAAKAAAGETRTEDLDSNASEDDILSSVTGGVDTGDAVAEDKGPSKKRLERGDVAKAMKAISPQAKACFAAEEYSGVVNVKYSVGPDGSVSGAQATGAHKSSKTGACVVSAVQKASFPAFSGAAMSFSFPFLLSP